MIITCHLLAGAAIVTKIHNPLLSLPLAFISHYFLDFIPHIEYEPSPKRSVNGKINWVSFFLKIGLDFLIGTLIILIISKNKILPLAGGLLGILGDFDNIIFLFPALFKNKILKSYADFFKNKLHPPENKKIPFGVKILTQVIVALVAIYFLK